MSILIKGMEMPTSCWRCPLCLTVDPETYRCIPTGQEFESTFDAIDHIVCDCPLVPVPPHGRLIDERDALLAIVTAGQADKRFLWGETIKYSPSEVAEILGRSVPTIISAEEGE